MVASSRRGLPGGRARQLGYGFFLGYGLLFVLMLLQAALIERFSLGLHLAVLTVLALLGIVAAWRAVSAGRVAGYSNQRPHLARGLTALFLGLCLLHVILGAIEILHRPVFPPDAWINWMYRAKAWFHAGALLPMDEPGSWARGAVEHRYNVNGSHYPRFVPLIGLWTALALGQWSETLVNLPFVLLALALALAIYGEARTLGLPRWGSALCSYLLLSIPLMGTHLSLAGQADAWMAGYAGLGFVVILRGLGTRDRRSLLGGLALVAFSMCVKVEGSVWLLMALLLTCVCLLPRLSFLGLIVLVGAGLSAWLLEVSSFHLPLLGTVGVIEGDLHLALLGTHTLQPRNLSATFLRQFFASGGWHLLWPLLVLACLTAFRAVHRRQVTGALVFILLLIAANAFIFMLTSHGRWAEDLTAINRLALQFSPALIFSLVILSEPLRGPLSSLRPGVLAIAALLPLGALALLLLAGVHSGGSQGSNLQIRPGELIMRVGQGYLEHGARIISGFDQGIAVASTRQTLIADEHPLLRLETRGNNLGKATFFWRRSGSAEELHRLNLGGRGVRWRDLSRLPNWTGSLSEVGVLIYDDHGRDVRVEDLSFRSSTTVDLFALVLGAWFERHDWSMTSVNFLADGTAPLLRSAPLQVLLWLLLASLVVVAATYRSGAPRGAMLLVLAMIAWGALDIRWLAERIWRTEQTIVQYPLVTGTALTLGNDAEIQAVVDRAVADEPSNLPLVLASIGSDNEQRNQLLRAKYHALPRAAYVHAGSLVDLPTAITGDLLLFRQRYAGSAHALTGAQLVERVGEMLGTSVSVGFNDAAGVLLERRQSPPSGVK